MARRMSLLSSQTIRDSLSTITRSTILWLTSPRRQTVQINSIDSRAPVVSIRQSDVLEAALEAPTSEPQKNEMAAKPMQDSYRAAISRERHNPQKDRSSLDIRAPLVHPARSKHASTHSIIYLPSPQASPSPSIQETGTESPKYNRTSSPEAGPSEAKPWLDSGYKSPRVPNPESRRHSARKPSPPRPIVEDELQSLAREWNASVPSDDPPMRGDSDQLPIMLEVDVTPVEAARLQDLPRENEEEGWRGRRRRSPPKWRTQSRLGRRDIHDNTAVEESRVSRSGGRQPELRRISDLVRQLSL